MSADIISNLAVPFVVRQQAVSLGMTTFGNLIFFASANTDFSCTLLAAEEIRHLRLAAQEASRMWFFRFSNKSVLYLDNFFLMHNS